MRIVYVITSTQRGGAEHALYDLARALSKQNMVKVISLRPIGFYGAKLAQENVEVVSLNMGAYPKFKDFINLKKEILSFKPDAVHAMLYSAIQMCRILKSNFKLFTTPHFNYEQKGKFARIIDAALKMKDNLSLAESKSTAEFLLTFQRYDKHKVHVLLNEAGDTFEPSEQARARARANTPADTTVFINVSRLTEQKGQRYLLNAMAKLYAKNKNIELWLAGDGEDKDLLQELAKTLNIASCVKFLGMRDDINDLLNGADVFILPSVIESNSLALLEARAVGLPLICADTGDNSEICLHGKNGFICNVKDPVILCALMSELADNKTLRKNFAAASLSAPRAKNYAQQHLEIYNKH